MSTLSVLRQQHRKVLTSALTRSAAHKQGEAWKRFVTCASVSSHQECLCKEEQLNGANTGAMAALLAAVAALWHERDHDSVAGCDVMPAVAPAWAHAHRTAPPPPPPSAGAAISATGARKITIKKKDPPRNVMLHRLRSIRARHLADKYKVDWKNVLGEGAYGSVHSARLAASGEKVALKKISKRFTDSSSFKNETDALLRIYDNGGHPNISGLRDMYEDYNHFYLILDLVSGGEMFEHLINYGAYSEADAARLMQEVASALAFLHGVGVVHADLKPENLLLCSKNKSDGTIKMIDFGCAVVSHDNYHDDDDEDDVYDDEEMRPKKQTSVEKKVAKGGSPPSTGTSAYWSPERFEKGSIPDAATDMWSLGIILFIMLTGVHPFDVQGNSTDAEIEENIQNNPSPPLGPEFTSHLSPSAVDLIRKLMAKDPKERLTSDEMLHHPWILGETASTDKILDSDKKLSKFKDIRNNLEAGIFAVLVSHGHQDVSLSGAKPGRVLSRLSARDGGESAGQTHIMKKAFEVFDNGGKGFVTPEDLNRVVSRVTETEFSSRDTQELLKETLEASGVDENAPTGGSVLSLSDFSKLFSGLKHKHFPRGHVIFHAGDEGDAMYFLNSGKVEVKTRKGQLISFLRPGDFFGEGSLLDDKNRRFTTAKCATPVDVIKIKREEFDRYVASSAEAKKTLKIKWRARKLAYAKNLIRLQTNVKTRTLERGDIVYKEGDVGKSMFLVDDANGGVFEVKHGGTKVHEIYPGESFGESSLLLTRPRSSTVACASETCKLHEMLGEDFLAVVQSAPEMATSLRDMCRKRLFKKAVKAFSLERRRSLSNDDIVAAFHDADTDHSGHLSLGELRELMHRMDPTFPESDIVALLKFIDVDDDGLCSLEEFKRIFRSFEDADYAQSGPGVPT